MTEDERAIMSVVAPFARVILAATAVWIVMRLINSRKKPGRRFWIVLALVVVVGYPLSYGPALWIQGAAPGWIAYYIGDLYQPLCWLVGTTEMSKYLCDWYIRLWVTPGPHFVPR
jgi:hypothetical protein